MMLWAATGQSSLYTFSLTFALNSQTHCRDKWFNLNSLLGNFVNNVVHLCMCAHQIVEERPVGICVILIFILCFIIPGEIQKTKSSDVVSTQITIY